MALRARGSQIALPLYQQAPVPLKLRPERPYSYMTMNVAKLRSAAAGFTGPAVLPQPGQVLGGKYRIERTVAWGGMAAIFAAEHLVLGQRVAVKVMLGEQSIAAAGSARMLREARAAARLQSTHVARVFDAGVMDGGAPFLVMEYLEGRDLAAVLAQNGPLDPAQVADFALQALEGLAHAHAAGIVHRDLKPANLFLADGPDGSVTLKVLDFGISMSLADSPDPRFGTNPGAQVIGSPMYMSPEQVHNASAVDERTDIWSLGVTMYELLTGAVPFDGCGVGETLAAILEQSAPGIRSRRDDVPEGLDAAVLRCLARNREDRFTDVAALARAIAPFGTGARAGLVERIATTLANAREPSSLDPMLVTLPEAEVDALAPTMPPPAADSQPVSGLLLVRTQVPEQPAAPRRASTLRRLTRGVSVIAAACAMLTAALVVHTRRERHPALESLTPVAAAMTTPSAPPAELRTDTPASAPTEVIPTAAPVTAAAPPTRPSKGGVRAPTRPGSAQPKAAAPAPAPPRAHPPHRVLWPGSESAR